ncbi:MAG: hypothetical protein M3133_06970, partial [Actinomycetota bacterium]|nr:hypothetical protein [Actinomycetota bacterium]
MHPSLADDLVAVDALPVRLCLAGSHAAAIRRFIEGIVGWQPVERAAAPLVPPVLTVCDVAGSTQGDHDLPLLLLVAGDDLPAQA